MTTRDQDWLTVKKKLRAEGITCTDIYALEKDSKLLSRAAPVLIDSLGEIKSPHVKTDLVRVASSARIPPEPLIEELRRIRPEVERDARPSESLASMSPDDFLREISRLRTESTGAANLAWTIGEALRRRAHVRVYDDLVELLRDRRLGKARQMLPYALAKLKARRLETIDVLLEIVEDPDVTAQALDSLGKLKAVKALPLIRSYLDSPARLVRREAAKAVKKLDKEAGQLGSIGAFRPPSAPSQVELVEASASFDLDRFVTFLSDLAERAEGLASHVDGIRDRLESMEVEGEADFLLRVRFQGEDVPLHIRIFMSDVDSPDVGFFTRAPLANAIQRLMNNLG